MKIAIVDARKGERDATKSITVSYRNMIILAQELGAKLYVNPTQFDGAPHDYDAIICGFGSMATECDKQLDFLKRNKNARLYWLVGEYEQSTFAPLFYACRDDGRRVHIIRNFEHSMKCTYAEKQSFVEFNSLIYRRPNKPAEKKYDAIYWGRWRPGREKYFREYLRDGIHLSTSAKNMKQFLRAGCNPTLINSMAWTPFRESLNSFRYSIYVEDEFTHTHYNGLANRFFEALFCNVVQFFDGSCRETVQKSGVPFEEDWYVDGIEDLRSKIAESKYDERMNRQSALNAWAAAQRLSAIEKLREIVI